MEEFRAFNQPEDAAKAIVDYIFDRRDPLPDDVREQLREFVTPGNPVTGGSVTFVVAYTAELAFARIDDLPRSFLALAASCTAYCAANRVDNLFGERGAGILAALRRASGEAPPAGAAWPDRESDPEPRQQFVKRVEEPAPADAPAEPE